MDWKFAAKISALSVALIFVAFAIYKLKNKGLPSPVSSALHLKKDEEGHSRKAVLKREQKITLCPTRVSEIRQGSTFRLFQEGMTWVVETPQKKELDQVEVEKWFGKYCEVVGYMSGGRASKFQHKLMDFEYVDGSVSALKVSPTGMFLWQGQLFESPELQMAVGELRTLLGLNHSGSAPAQSQ